jgi:hypothetical protein
VDNPGEIIESSEWFRRGWTLRELIAPTDVAFFSSTWKILGTRVALRGIISMITGIEQGVLEDLGWIVGWEKWKKSIVVRISTVKQEMVSS